MNPASLAAAVGINGALIAALLLSSPEVLKPIERTLEGYNVPIPPRPPETKPEPLPKKAETPSPQPPLSRPDTPKTEVELPPRTDVLTGAADPAPPPQPTDLIGTGTAEPLSPPRPAPLVTAAAPDPRAEFQPPYPPALRRAEVEGRITVRVLIGADGRVKAVEPVGAGEPGFFEATRRYALARWRFRPATRDGEPYESWKVMTVRFELAD